MIFRIGIHAVLAQPIQARVSVWQDDLINSLLIPLNGRALSYFQYQFVVLCIVFKDSRVYKNGVAYHTALSTSLAFRGPIRLVQMYLSLDPIEVIASLT